LRIATKSKSDLIKNNITFWDDFNNFTSASNIARMTDGNTSSSGALDYAVHPLDADGKYILFDFKGVHYNNGSFKLFNRKGIIDRINGSTVDFLKEGVVVSTRTIDEAGEIVEIIPESDIVFDQVRLTFSGNAQNFREVEILGKNSTLLIDSGAPEPLKNNAWRINREIADSSGAFTVGDEIKVTLLLDESVILANIGSNKIVVAGKEFLLTGVNGEHTDALEFVYTVKVDNNVNAEDFNIDSTKDIVLTDVKDVDGNSIDFSTITDSVALANLALDTEFSIGGGNKISQTKGVYEKTSSRGWNAAITSTKGFSGDGCVIAKIGSNNKYLMVGLSTDSNNNEGNYHAINFAIYVHNSGNIVGIYENGRSVKNFSEDQYPYTAGDYLKIERDGTTINYYLVKVGDDPATEGTLLYTSSKILSADTELFLDGSFHDVGAKLSDIQVFNNKLPLSVSAKSIRQVSTTGDLEKNNVFDQVFNEHQFNNDDETGISSDKGESTTNNTNTTNNTTITNNTTHSLVHCSKR
jgi:hypothetical protein